MEEEKLEMEEDLQEETEGELKLHPETVKYRQDTYSSLTDLNGVDVFSEAFRGSVERVLQERSRREQEVEEEIFVSSVFPSRGAEEQLVSKLFLGQEERVLLHEYEKETGRLSFVDIGMVLASMLAVAALYLFIFQDRKARKR